jgi:hypothetical protein
MDRPAREPEHLLFELAKDIEVAARGSGFLSISPGRAHALPRSFMAGDMGRIFRKDNPNLPANRLAVSPQAREG